MRRWLVLAGRVAVGGCVTWLTAALCERVLTDRSIASMALLLEVLVFTTFGDWLLAVLVSALASMAFSWYFVDSLGSFRITSVEGAVTWLAMLCTALTGSRLAISGQRRAAEAIRRREEMERLQHLGQLMLASASVHDAALDIVSKIVEVFDVRGARLRIEGYPDEFVAGELIPPWSRVELQSQGPAAILELCGASASEEVRNALGNLVDLVLDRARNAEERARIEAAQRGDELRTTVLNALAHNFKTPLTSIKAASSMLRGSPVLAAEARELASVIDEEADRLSELIRDSLDLARIESHQANPRRELCSLSEIARAVASRAGRYLRGRSLVLNLPDDLPPVWGDTFLLEQMLTQVVDNAWKYSRPGAEIRIVASRRDGELQLMVQNEGRTIPEEERERIFGKFFRGAANRSRVEGTGLGLAIARTIAEAHGGSIWLDSEPEGPAFRFSLPVGDAGNANDRESNDFVDRR